MLETLRTILEQNRDLIFLSYGLAYFMLGFAIVLQSRHASRLDFARTVTWLAGFGFAHGLHEWGEYFIPIQATYLPGGVITVLYGLRVTLLAVSFAYLFEFGARLLGSERSIRILRRINISMFLVWLVSGMGLVPILLPDPQVARDVADAIARYLLGFPGALLAAYGLRRHTLDRIRPLQAPHIVSMLRKAGLTLGVYAVFTGLLPPPVPFFPGSVINSRWFTDTFVLPPAVIRTVLGLVLTYTIIRALEVFDLEVSRRLERMEQEQILAAERTRLARELHDGAIQKVYTAGLLLESGKQMVKHDPEAQSRLERTIAILNDAINDLRINLSELRPEPSGASLKERLQDLTSDASLSSMFDIRLSLDLPENDRLDRYRVDHIAAIVSEALANVLRHSRASQVEIAAHVADGRLRLTVQDDGIGIPDSLQRGFGLRNMHDRARLIQGTLDVSPGPQRGTRVKLEAAWQGENE